MDGRNTIARFQCISYIQIMRGYLATILLSFILGITIGPRILAVRSQSSTRQGEHSLWFNESRASTYFHRGNKYLNFGSWELALRDYDEALRLDPHGLYIYEQRGEANLMLGNFEEALHDYSEILKGNQRSSLAYCGIAIAKEKLGNTSAAMKDYDKAIELDPDYAIAFHNRGRLKERLGDQAGSTADSKKAEQLGWTESKPR